MEVDEEDHHKLHRLKADYRLASKFKRGVCSECGQPVKTKDKAKLQQQIEELEQRIAKAKAYAAYKEQKTTYLSSRSKRQALEQKVKELREEVEARKKDWQIYEVLRDVRKPVAYDGPELDVEREVSKLTKAEKLVDLLRTCTSHLDTV